MPQTASRANIVSQGPVFGACQRCRKWDKAVALFGDMLRTCLERGTIFNGTVAAFEMGHQSYQALALLVELEETQL